MTTQKFYDILVSIMSSSLSRFQNRMFRLSRTSILRSIAKNAVLTYLPTHVVIIIKRRDGDTVFFGLSSSKFEAAYFSAKNTTVNVKRGKFLLLQSMWKMKSRKTIRQRKLNVLRIARFGQHSIPFEIWKRVLWLA
jgi:hypothetical protein